MTPFRTVNSTSAFTTISIEDPLTVQWSRHNHIGHVMNIETIAEFVENNAILDALRRIGVDYAQGYGIEKPRLSEFSMT